MRPKALEEEEDGGVAPDTDEVIALFGTQMQAAASALIFDAEDVAAAQKYAPKWADLLNIRHRSRLNQALVPGA